MTYGERAIWLALTGDSLTATLASGSTTSVLQLATGGAAAWEPDTWVNLSGGAWSSAQAPRRFARVAEVDEALDQLTLDRPLSSAPAAGVVIGAGYQQWVMPAGGAVTDLLHYIQRDEPNPGSNLFAVETDPRVVVFYGEIASTRQAFTATLERWRFRFISRSHLWAAALAARVRQLFDGERGALTIPGRSVYSIEALEAVPQFRDDALVEKHVQVALVTSRAEAA